MGVAEPLRRPTASRGRKRPRAAARLVGTSRAACCRLRLRVNPFLVWFVFLWLLFSGVWETLIFGTGDWFAFGEPFFCGLFTPTYPLPGHRLVPESHIYIYINKYKYIYIYTCISRFSLPQQEPSRKRYGPPAVSWVVPWKVSFSDFENFSCPVPTLQLLVVPFWGV